MDPNHSQHHIDIASSPRNPKRSPASAGHFTCGGTAAVGAAVGAGAAGAVAVAGRGAQWGAQRRPTQLAPVAG
ncbi:hypothetical protein WJX75_008572 [Coccomyxa subellipsoidea]|uniref:Uncharacterized protein n=1 Tax=Coccomyxa subellipsoidea TaxID=248742 RepID=A0ABR2YSS0_9CHLO